MPFEEVGHPVVDEVFALLPRDGVDALLRVEVGSGEATEVASESGAFEASMEVGAHDVVLHDAFRLAASGCVA